MAIVFGALLQATMPQAMPGSDRPPYDAIFLYGRARYFSALVTWRDCRGQFPKQTEALGTRFDAVHTTLGKRFGGRYFDLPPIDPQTMDAKRPCDAGTLAGFEDKIVAIEQLLSGDK